MTETNAECGEIKIFPIKNRIMRWKDSDPAFDTQTKLFRCEREPNHEGDHYGYEDSPNPNQYEKLIAYWRDDV